jgi:hypothetical protein
MLPGKLKRRPDWCSPQLPPVLTGWAPPIAIPVRHETSRAAWADLTCLQHSQSLALVDAAELRAKRTIDERKEACGGPSTDLGPFRLQQINDWQSGDEAAQSSSARPRPAAELAKAPLSPRNRPGQCGNRLDRRLNGSGAPHADAVSSDGDADQCGRCPHQATATTHFWIVVVAHAMTSNTSRADRFEKGHF